jgi:putative nucleotidyltransferase with HDIG domain
MLSADLIPSRKSSRLLSLEDQARALAVVLREEFGVPFAFFEARAGARVRTVGSPLGVVPAADLTVLPPEVLARLAGTGRAQARPLAAGGHRLTLPLSQGGGPVLVAIGDVPALAASGRDAAREQTALEKWAQAVADRVRLVDQLAAVRRPDERATPPSAPNTLPWEGLLALDALLRRLRCRRETHAGSRRIVEAAFALLGARTLAWVPRDAEAPVVVLGDDGLPAAAYRRLTVRLGGGQARGPAAPVLIDRFAEQEGGADFPGVHTLLALPVTDQGLVGWVLAVNKKGPAADGGGEPAAVPFRKTDAALLTPFVGLLEMFHRWSARHEELKDLLVGLTRALTSAIDAKDSYTFGHSERVARIAVELAREMGLEGDDLGDVYLAGLLHDIGKIGVRDEVLRKPGKLTPEEEEHIRRHVLVGYAILADLRQIRSLLPGVLCHHERFDGKGYPDGLAGEAIPLLGRILAVADAYDAMTTARPYRDPMPWERVERILAEGAGTQWDARVVEAFQRCRHKVHTIRQRGVGESLRAALDGALRSEHYSQASFLPGSEERAGGPRGGRP